MSRTAQKPLRLIGAWLKFKYFPNQKIENYSELFKLKKGLYLVWLHLILKYVTAGQNIEI